MCAKGQQAIPYVYESDRTKEKLFLIRISYRDPTDHLTTNAHNYTLPAMSRFLHTFNILFSCRCKHNLQIFLFCDM